MLATTVAFISGSGSIIVTRGFEVESSDKDKALAYSA